METGAIRQTGQLLAEQAQRVEDDPRDDPRVEEMTQVSVTFSSHQAATGSNTSGSLAEEEPDEYCENFCICDYFFSISPSPCAPASMYVLQIMVASLMMMLDLLRADKKLSNT